MPMTNAQRKRAQRFYSTSAKLTGDYKSLNLSGQRRRNAGRMSLKRNLVKYNAANVKTIYKTNANGVTRAFLQLPPLSKGAKGRVLVRSPHLLTQRRKMDLYYKYPGLLSVIQASRGSDSADYKRSHADLDYDSSSKLYKYESEYAGKMPDYHSKFLKYIFAAKNAKTITTCYKNLKLAQTFAYFVFPRSNSVHGNIRAAVVARGVKARNAQLAKVVRAAKAHAKSGATPVIVSSPKVAIANAQAAVSASAVPQSVLPNAETLVIVSEAAKSAESAPGVVVPVPTSVKNIVVKDEPIEDVHTLYKEEVNALLAARPSTVNARGALFDKLTSGKISEAEFKESMAELENAKTGGSLYRRFKHRKFLRVRRH